MCNLEKKITYDGKVYGYTLDRVIIYNSRVYGYAIRDGDGKISRVSIDDMISKVRSGIVMGCLYGDGGRISMPGYDVRLVPRESKDRNSVKVRLAKVTPNKGLNIGSLNWGKKEYYDAGCSLEILSEIDRVLYDGSSDIPGLARYISNVELNLGACKGYSDIVRDGGTQVVGGGVEKSYTLVQVGGEGIEPDSVFYRLLGDLTKDYVITDINLSQLYNTLNNAYFYGSLPTICVKWSRRIKASKTTCKVIGGNVRQISVSVDGNKSMPELVSSLIREMVYVACRDGRKHGDKFNVYMTYFSGLGIDVYDWRD